MNRHATLLLFVVIWQCALVTPNATALEPIEQLDRKIVGAQAQRVEALHRAVKELQQQYRDGAVDFGRVTTAQRDLCEAVVLTAKTPDERIAYLEEQLKIATKLRDLARIRFRNGATTAVDVHEAEAACLHVEIRILHEQRKKLAADDG